MPTGERARIVVDTNVLVSAALLPLSTSARALHRALEEFQLIQFAATLAEILDVIMRPSLSATSTRKDGRTSCSRWRGCPR